MKNKLNYVGVLVAIVAVLGFVGTANAFVIGDRGQDVRDLQITLIEAGFDIPLITSGVAQPGYFGVQTQAALAAYEGRGVKLGAFPGGDILTKINIGAGEVNSGHVATTSLGTAITVSAADLSRWVDASLVSFTQIGVSTPTLTLPASSTIPHIVPRPGDRQTFCLRNATTTAALTVILAGGTGTSLNVASSTTVLGSSSLTTGETGCLTLIREAATDTTFDISVLLTTFK